MSHPHPLSQWMETVSMAFENLSRPQAKVLAYWSYGMVLAKACGIVLVSAALALELGEKGKKRRELDVSTCFAPLLRWVLSWWPVEETRLALALDATTLKKRATRAVYQCGLSRLCHPGGLESGGSGGKRRVAAALVRLALAFGGSGAGIVDRTGAQ